MYDVREEKYEITKISFDSKTGYRSWYNSEKSVGVRFIKNGNIGLVAGPEFKTEMLFEAEKLARLGKKRVKVEKHEKVFGDYKKDIGDIEKDYIDEMKKLLNVKKFQIHLSNEKIQKKYSDSYGSEITQHLNYNRVYVIFQEKVGGKLVSLHVGFSWMKGKLPEPTKIASEVNELAKDLKKAKLAKPGDFDLILDPDLAGVFFHEAVGHASEADLVLANASVFKDKIGETIAVEELSMHDDPTMYPENGFYFFDDEGIKARKTTIIKRGKLVGYLHSLLTSSEMNCEPTGNGRAQSPYHVPIPRMSNITIDKGDWSFEEMIEEIKEGYLGVGSKGGVVEPAIGQFLFNAKIGYYIKDGEIKHPVVGVSFGGNLLETLKHIKIGNKIFPTYRGGFCGKNGQRVPVAERMPYVLVRGAKVGGRNN